jgi:basic amino acid/polyamine antiporter, APA family
VARPDGERSIGLGSAVLLVASSMIGTGVFTTGGLLAERLGSPLAALAAWFVGGLVALAGALAYGELAAALPRSGGEYHLLGRIYHPAVGFVAGAVSITVGFAAPTAASALAFGSYLHALVPQASPVAAAAVLVVALAALHAWRATVGYRVQAVVTGIGITLMVVLIVAAALRGSAARLATSPGTLLEGVVSPPFALGLILVAFAYSGWNGAVYVAGEVRRPQRTVPLALLLGTLAVMVLYLGLNAAFLAAVPARDLSGVVEVGHVAAVRLLGPRLGAVLSGAILVALAASASAQLIQGSRVSQVMGEDHRRLAFLGRRTRRGMPAIAVGLQAALALVMLATASFGALLTYIGVTLSLMTAATVVGLFWLRQREPALPRPYRAWGYPVTPLFFVALSLWMVGHAVVQRPIVVVTSLATIAAALGCYCVAGTRPTGGSPR